MVKILFMLLIITGCSMSNCSMSNEEMIKGVEYCKKNNMYPNIMVNLFGDILSINCLPLHVAKARLKEEVFNYYIKELEREDNCKCDCNRLSCVE